MVDAARKSLLSAYPKTRRSFSNPNLLEEFSDRLLMVEQSLGAVKLAVDKILQLDTIVIVRRFESEVLG